VVFTFLLRTVDKLGASVNTVGDLTSRLDSIAKDASLHFVLPRTSLTPLLSNGVLSALQVAYAYAGWKFSFHFLSRANDEFGVVASALRSANSDALPVLGKLRMALKTNSFVEGSVLDSIFANVELVKWLYNDFATRNCPDTRTFISSLLLLLLLFYMEGHAYYVFLRPRCYWCQAGDGRRGPYLHPPRLHHRC
jgi:glutamate dehydrogenase